MGESRYGYTKKVNEDFGSVVRRVGDELKKEGFGVLTEIDVEATFKKKLNLPFRPYKILGACNPELANKALASDPDIGLLLPCNIVIQKSADGGVTVSIANPKAMFTLVDNPNISDIAEEADKRLRRVFDALE